MTHAPGARATSDIKAPDRLEAAAAATASRAAIAALIRVVGGMADPAVPRAAAVAAGGDLFRSTLTHSIRRNFPGAIRLEANPGNSPVMGVVPRPDLMQDLAAILALPLIKSQ